MALVSVQGQYETALKLFNGIGFNDVESTCKPHFEVMVLFNIKQLEHGRRYSNIYNG